MKLGDILKLLGRPDVVDLALTILAAKNERDDLNVGEEMVLPRVKTREGSRRFRYDVTVGRDQ